MIRVILSWLSMVIFINGYSQVITVTNESTGEPLVSAIISGKTSENQVQTNENGQADLSLFMGADTILISHADYTSVMTNYVTLKAHNFHIALSKSDILLNEVVVSSYQEGRSHETSLHIEPLQLKEIEQQGTFNLTDALSKMPGIAQLSTGIGVSKPVIRGLFGNRILVLFSGLRFDNQQWQDEHGLGLSDIGIARVEVIKGPLSMLYGTEAVGGVINIIEETAPELGKVNTDIGISGNSNTGGGTMQAGVRANKGDSWYRLRMAATNHADYTDGNNNRVVNSRFNGYYLKGTFGFTKNNWRSENHYHFSYNNFGFVLGDSTSLIAHDDRWDRQMSGPHHIVMLNMISSDNQIQLGASRLRVNAGIQSNMRSEDEGGGELSLKMHLLTGQYALKWSKQLSDNVLLVLANNTSVENNANYGRRKIVPDAWMAETALSAYLKHNFKAFVLEYGLGGGSRYIKTLLTPTVNSAEKDILPFQQQRYFANGMLGASFIPNDKWNMKLNLSTGVRAPNLAELSSNGLHEGVYTYEIGDPDLKNEQNINADAGVYYANDVLQFDISGFYNQFYNYIYLQPTAEEWFGFPIYRFEQHQAQIYGGEAGVSINPPFAKGFKISATYSGLIGALNNGDYLPYMPAQKIVPEIRFKSRKIAKKTFYCFVNTDFVFKKELVNAVESQSPAYQLVNAGAGMVIHGKSTNYSLNLAVTNLLNEAYYDHMSRFKNYGLLNMGRNISINLKINFINNLKNEKNEKDI